MSKNIQIRKTDNTEEVKEFLREVVSHQIRIKKQQDSVLNPLEKQDPENSLYSQEEVIIPAAMKPFLSREINFQVFLDILSDKVDAQRILLNFKQFR